MIPLSDLILTVAQAAPGAPASQPKPWWADLIGSPMTMFALVLVVFWLFVMRGKQSQEKQRRGLLDNLKKGDEIQTIGGALGKVIETRDDRVLVKVDESSNAKIWFSRSAIHKVLTGEKAETK